MQRDKVRLRVVIGVQHPVSAVDGADHVPDRRRERVVGKHPLDLSTVRRRQRERVVGDRGEGSGDVRDMGDMGDMGDMEDMGDMGDMGHP